MKCLVYSVAFSFLDRRVLFTPLLLLVLFLGCVLSRNVDAVTNNASTTVLPVLDIDLGNQSSAHDIVKRPEKRSSAALLPLPSSSSVILKDDDVSAMDRIEVPIIYHTGPHLGKNFIPYNHKPDYNHQNFISINPGLKPLYNSLSDQGPQVFPPQGTPSNFPHLQQASFSSFAPASFNFPYATLSNHPGATNNHPVFRNSAASQSDSFDKLCPASKPYPVYIEKKVPVTVEKRVPYPVKVPYPVHHYHYDNIKHRNIAAPPGYEPGKTPPPSPPPDDEDAPIKESDDRVVKGVGGLFLGGDSGGFKGDTKEELYEMSEEDQDEDDYESYDQGRFDPPPPPPPKPSNYRNDRRPPRPSPRAQQQRGRDARGGRDFNKRNPKSAGPEGGFSRNANVKAPPPLPQSHPVPQQLKLSTRKPRQGTARKPEPVQTPIRRHDEDMDQLEEIKIQATTQSPEELILLPKLKRPGSTLLETNIETNSTNATSTNNDNNNKTEQ